MYIYIYIIHMCDADMPLQLPNVLRLIVIPFSHQVFHQHIQACPVAHRIEQLICNGTKPIP